MFQYKILSNLINVSIVVFRRFSNWCKGMCTIFSFFKLKISQSFPHIKYTSFDENRAFKMNFFDQEFFHMNFDLANGCKNECKGKNGKSCS